MTINIVTNSTNHFYHSHEIREVAETSGAIYLRLVVPPGMVESPVVYNDAVTVFCADASTVLKDVVDAICEGKNITIKATSVEVR